LKAERGISCEQIVLHIECSEVLDVFEYPNKERYPGQQVLVVEVNGYAYAYPSKAKAIKRSNRAEKDRPA
jgi:hypothetical protein